MKKLEDVILFQLDWTSKVAKQNSQRELDKLGLNITVDQWVLLKIIAERSPLTQKELANQSFRDPASITRTLDILSRKGFIQRVSIPDNRRSYNIELTNEGDLFITKNMPIITGMRERSVQGISQDELATVSTVLEKIRRNMS